jgi:hypothetical protein
VQQLLPNGITYQATGIFITTIMRPSNLTSNYKFSFNVARNKSSSVQNYMPWRENASTAVSFVINEKNLKNSSNQLRKKF